MSTGRWLQVLASDPLEVRWTSLPYPEAVQRVLSAEVDGRVEIVVVTASTAVPRIYIHDSASKALLGSFPISSGNVRAAVVDNLAGNGEPEIALCDDNAFFVYDYSSGALVSRKEGFSCSDLAIGQVDADAQLEISWAGNLFGGFLLDGLTLEVQWADPAGFGSASRLIDVDQDGLDELAAGRNEESSLRVIEPLTGSTRWEIEEPFHALAAGDLDGDGLEVLLAGMWTIRAFASSTGVLHSEIPMGDLEILALAVGQVDGDEQPEVLACGYHERSVPPHLLVADGQTGQIEARAEGLSEPFLKLHGEDVDDDGVRDVITASASWIPAGPEPALAIFDARSRELAQTIDPFPESTAGLTLGELIVRQSSEDFQKGLCFTFTTNGPDPSGIRCVDGATFETKWSHELANGIVPTTLHAAEVDEEPGQEIIAGLSDGSVVLLDGDTGASLWGSGTIALSRRVEVLRTFTPNPAASVGIAVLAVGSGTGVLVLLDSSDGSIAAGPWEVSARAMDVAGLEADAQEEIFLGDQEGDVTAFDTLTGEESPPIAQFPEPVVALRIADATRDGLADLSVIQSGQLVVRGLVGPSFEWASGPIDAVTSPSRLTVGDLDADPLIEIALATRYGFVIFEGPYQELFLDGFESGDTRAWSLAVPRETGSSACLKAHACDSLR